MPVDYWLIIRCFPTFKDEQKLKLLSQHSGFFENIFRSFHSLNCRNLLHCSTCVEHMVLRKQHLRWAFMEWIKGHFVFCRHSDMLLYNIPSNRSEYLQTENFALASDIWYVSASISIACCKPGTSITVDEQLFPMKALCRFAECIVNKQSNLETNFGWLWMLK